MLKTAVQKLCKLLPPQLGHLQEVIRLPKIGLPFCLAWIWQHAKDLGLKMNDHVLVSALRYAATTSLHNRPVPLTWARGPLAVTAHPRAALLLHHAGGVDGMRQVVQRSRLRLSISRLPGLFLNPRSGLKLISFNIQLPALKSCIFFLGLQGLTSLLRPFRRLPRRVQV